MFPVHGKRTRCGISGILLEPVAPSARNGWADLPQQSAGNSRPAVAELRGQRRLGFHAMQRPQRQRRWSTPPTESFSTDNKNTNIGPADGREAHRALQMSMAQVVDGTTKTLMLSENLHTCYWTYGQSTTTTSTIKDTKHLFGFIWKNPPPGTNRADQRRQVLRQDFARSAGLHGSLCRPDYV